MPKSESGFYLIHKSKIGCIDMDNSLKDNMVFDNAAVDLKLEPISELHMSEIDQAKLVVVFYCVLPSQKILLPAFERSETALNT